MIFRSIRLSMLLIVLTSAISAQQSQIKFKHLSVQDGLSQSWVRCIYQDSYGFMWFGTGGNGINKYNGYEFKVYKKNPRIRNSLANNLIHAICEDTNRNLWVGTQTGLNLYDRENDCFKVFPGLQSQYITGFYETDHEILFVTTINNIYEINLKNNNVKPYCNEASGCLQDIFVDAIVEDADGNLWLGSSNGLYLLDTLNKSFTIFKHNDNDPGSLSDNVIMSMIRDAEGRIWIGTENKGLSLMKFRDDNSSQPYFINFTHDPNKEKSISEGAIRAILDDGKGNLWIGTENGGLDILNLGKFNQGNYHFAHYRNNIDDETSISYNSIYSLFQDDQGTIWVGTYGNGLNYYNELLFKFDHYVHRKNITSNISNNMVNVIYRGENHLWVGTEGGLSILNKSSNTFEDFKYYGDTRISIGSSAVWVLLEDSYNNLWIGTWAEGLSVYNKESKKFIRFLHIANDPESISSNNIFGILEDREGYLWVATMNGGLNRYNYRTNTFKAYRANFAEENSISGDWVRTLIESSFGELWISTSTGVDLFNKETEEFINFTHDPYDSTSISYNGAIMLFEDSKENIWLGTEGGLNLFIRDDSSFIYYQEKDGLPDNSIKGICEDDHGNLWLSTNKGISKFIDGINRPRKPIFENFNMNDGLQGDEFNRRACFKDKDGFLYFGGTNGLNVFHPDSLRKNTYTPPVILTDFLLFNKPVKINSEDSPLTKHISVSEEITLSYNQSVITFQFAALSFLFPENNHYQYLMDGFDEHWSDVGTKREATYTNLDPGKYVFQVKGSNNDGIWNEHGVSLEIIILPPWWKTIWFRVLVILAAIGLVVGFYYYRLNQLTKQKYQLQEKVKQRTKEIEEKNSILRKQANELNEANTILEERQQRIEEQAEELRTQRDEVTQTNETLLKLNATKDKFFSIIAHDLKNPFTSILGFCEVLTLRYDNYDDSKRKHLIAVIDQSANNLFKLLENLLQWSRSQIGNIKFNPEEFPVPELISNITALVSNSLEEKGLKLITDYPEDLIIYADKNMLHTVLRNLVSNSIKFTESGEIKIKIDADTSFITFSITDTGVGMDKEKKNNIFEIGMSKSTEGTRGEQGTGLGLIICKEFVEKNGGTVGVESLVGKGSTFWFTVPVRKT